MQKLLFLFLLGIAIFAQSQNFTDAISYNDFIVGQQTKVGSEIIKFNDLMGSENPSKEIIKTALDTLVIVAEQALQTVKQAGPFEDNIRFYNASTELFGYYVKSMSTFYYQLLDLFFVTEYTDEISNQIETIVNAIVEQEAMFDQEFAEAQQEFASKYKITLGANELQEELHDNY